MTSDGQILAPPASSGEDADPRRWLTLVILLLAALMNLLDVSIVNIAVPSIQRDLGASYADIQWALAGYTLAYALVLITGGRLGDTFGRKRLFLIGVAGFTAMSALCGAAQSPGQLIAFRVAQGAMGGIMIPQVLSVIQVMFPPSERIKALAGFGVTAGLGTVSGPLLGGLLIQGNLLGLDWRPIFLINVPVGIVALAAAAVLVRESRAPSPPRLDPVGVALISAALLLLLYPLVQGRQLGWPWWTFVSMACSVPVLAAFVGYERIKARRDGSPLVQLAVRPAGVQRRDRHRHDILPRRHLVRADPHAVPADRPRLHGAARGPDVPAVLRRGAGRLGRGGKARPEVRPRRDDDRRAGHGGGDGRPDHDRPALRPGCHDPGTAARPGRGGPGHGHGSRAARRHPA